MQGFVFNTRRADVPGRRACARRSPTPSTSSGPTAPLLRRLHPHAELLLQLRARLARPAEPRGAGSARAATAAACPTELFTRAYEPPATAAAGEPARRTCRRRSGCSGRRAGWCATSGWWTRRPASPCASRSCSSDAGVRAHRAALRRRTWSASASTARVRTVDTAQYQYRMDHFDFDMTVRSWGQSQSPGNEQRDYWTSETADVPGQPQPRRHQRPGRRRADRARHRRPRPRRLVRADARPRPRAAVGPLRGPALAHPELPRRLLGQVRPAAP